MPDYQPRLTRQSPELDAEDIVGPLPNIRVSTPKNGNQVSRYGLPGNPSPHIRTSPDPAIQVSPGTEWSEQRRSPSLGAESYPRPSRANSLAVQIDLRPVRSFETLTQLQAEPYAQQTTHVYPQAYTKPQYAHSNSYRREMALQQAIDMATQTEEHMFQASHDEIEYMYCRGCQQRLLRRSNTNSSIASSTASSPDQSSATPQEPSTERERSSISFGKKFKIPALQRRSVDEAAREAAKLAKKAQRKDYRRSARRFEYKEISPTDHWGAE